VNTSRQLGGSDELDEQVSSYDDLFVSVDSAGRLSLKYPACGFIAIPLRETTLSDLTNAAMDHLSERHLYSLTLPSRGTAAARAGASANGARSESSGYFTDHFWSLVALLDEDGLGVEALVRALASSGEEDVLTFQEQLMNAVGLLDTREHRTQKIRNLANPLQTVPAALSDGVFAQVRLAVVASGRDVWLDVLREPARLAGEWSLQAAQALKDAPMAALTRIAPTPLHSTARVDSSGAQGTAEGSERA
jgi:hypothetical protein